jgi:hypothetical protein
MRLDGNLHTTEAELTQAGFVCHPVEAGRIARRVWTNDEAGFIAHRYPDGVTFGYTLDGADKVDADQELFDYLEQSGVTS